MNEKVSDLEMEGDVFRLSFTDVNRADTTRGFHRYHDDREKFPAWLWRGKLSIRHKATTNTSDTNFRTEAFWKGHVKGLEFQDILLLVLIAKNLHTGNLNPEGLPKIVDHLALKTIVEKTFASGEVYIRPIRFDDNWGLKPDESAYLNFDKIVVTDKLVSVE